MGYLSRLPGLLQTQANLQKPLARHRTANLLAALDTVYLLLAPLPHMSGSQVRQTRGNLTAAKSPDTDHAVCMLWHDALTIAKLEPMCEVLLN